MLVYNGEVQDPLGAVYDGDGAALTLGVDYTVEYSAEVKNAGAYYAIVTGIGDYVGAYVVPFAVHKVFELGSDAVLEFDASIVSADVYTMVKFTAPTDAEYTFVINMQGYSCAELLDSALERVNSYEGEDGLITIELELNAGETVYLDVYTENSKPTPAEVSVEFVCDEHNIDDGVVTLMPTCDSEGTLTYTCQNGCGHSYTEALASLGHDFAEISRYYIECIACGEGICDHICHKDGIYQYIWKIFDKLYDLLDIEGECDCGEIH